LVKDDFCLFLQREDFSGFTLNPFRYCADDYMLTAMFREAAQSTPAVVVFEDLDRCYPVDKEQEPVSRISLQQLLNHLDGIGNQDGIIVVATANNPSILDAAILRRPGRFDRVVGLRWRTSSNLHPTTSLSIHSLDRDPEKSRRCVARTPLGFLMLSSRPRLETGS
jgi:hypothetical protein